MASVQIEKPKLIAEVQEFLSSWLNEKPEVRTVAHLSRETGVTDSSIRRLLNNRIKIADDSIFKLLTHVVGVSEYQAFLDVFSDRKEIASWFITNYSYLKTSPVLQEYKPSSTAEEITGNYISFSVYALVAAKSGVTPSYIKDQFGVRGEIELENLIQKGVIVLNGDELFPKDQKKLKITREQTINLLPDITRSFLKKDHKFNARSLEIEAVSKDGYIKLMDIYEHFLGDVVTTFKNHPGDIPVVVAGFFDSFTSQPYFEGDKNEAPN